MSNTFNIGDVVMVTDGESDVPRFTSPHPYTDGRGEKYSKGPFVIVGVPGERPDRRRGYGDHYRTRHYILAIKHAEEPGRDPGWVMSTQEDRLTEWVAGKMGDLHSWRGWFLPGDSLRLADSGEKERLSVRLTELHLAITGEKHPRDMDLDEFKAFVAKKVDEEARRQGWCERVDGWLDELGLERPSPKKVRFTIEYSAEVDLPPGVTVEQLRERASRWETIRTMGDANRRELAENFRVGPYMTATLTCNPREGMKIEEV